MALPIVPGGRGTRTHTLGRPQSSTKDALHALTPARAEDSHRERTETMSMDTRFHERFDLERGSGPPSSPDQGGVLSERRAQVHHYLAAGEDAIVKALSRDSEAFLDATRQEGGE
jgi:hypothetical protein